MTKMPDFFAIENIHNTVLEPTLQVTGERNALPSHQRQQITGIFYLDTNV